MPEFRTCEKSKWGTKPKEAHFVNTEAREEEGYEHVMCGRHPDTQNRLGRVQVIPFLCIFY